jgi:trk system potassium uptake protein TrkA
VFGGALAKRLSELGHKIIALDKRPEALARVQDVVETAVVADGSDRSVLEELGVGLTKIAVVSLGDNLADTIMAALHLKEMELDWVVASARSPEQERILKKVGADEVVFPQRDAALRLATTLLNPNLLDYLPLDPEFSIAEVTAPDEFVGKSLLQLDLRRQKGLNLIAYRPRGVEMLKVIIQPDHVIGRGDTLLILGRHQDIDRLYPSDENQT